MRDRGRGSVTGTPLLGWLLAAALLTATAAAPVQQPERPAPTLLVLGAAQYNGQPSPAFRARLDHALRLYRAGGVTRIVVSGGTGPGDRYSEGAVGAAYLRAHGVPASALAAETHARSTLQNLRLSRALLRGPVTLVTDSVHARRALALARAEGLRATVHAAPAPHASAQYRQREWLLLGAYALLGPLDHTRAP
ncbi:YdcF family protein [Deinococcus maricopensis]|uniref:DUF218 domain-containing protein n=1 Tax=Deinococcus maricopensis (strain DSM 21211 / LMG 22137 / NRRL B-23946 / LB-34) TaxID=709986 RepID=E8UB97_DEIML|nr:YdcF family protein [Deinococcus maricopensis]ADV68336.1 protein of unknown function DUF218 [Deinococcus maricopensis DSM 21211]